MTLSSQVSRAELLHALQEYQNDKQSLAEVAELFGYVAPEGKAKGNHTKKQEKDGKQGSGSTLKKTENLLNPPPARAQVTYYYLAYRERYASEEVAKQDQPACFDGVETLDDKNLTDFWPAQQPVAPKSLVQAKPMTPTIRRNLRQEVGRRLDVKKLVKQVAKQAPLKQIPTHSRLLPAGRVTVIADLNQRLVPFWEDMDEACQLIKQKHGKIGLDIRVLAKDEPLQDYYAYDDWRERKLASKPWEKIPAQSVVFIMSDLGQLAPEDSMIRKRWLSFVQLLNRRGIKPLVLTPIAAEHQATAFQTMTQQLLWRRFGRLKAQKTKGNSEVHQQNVERVLSFLSLSPHIEPELLRTLCELLPYHEGSVGIEADVYLHPHVQFGLTSIAIRPDRREHYQQCFAELDEELQQAVFDCVQRHHSAQFASVWAETVLNAEPLMTVPANLVEKAEQWMLSFAKRYYGETSHDGMLRFARRHFSRLSVKQQQEKEYASIIYGLTRRAEIKSGGAIPEHLNASVVNQVTRERSETREYCVRQIDNGFTIHLVEQETVGQQGHVLGTFTSAQSTILIDHKEMRLPVERLPLEESIHLDTGQEKMIIQALKKPSWASSMSMLSGNFHPHATLLLAGQEYELAMHPANELEKVGRWDYIMGEPHIVESDEYGLFADVTFSGITQRFRYIEPTTFMMGSPENEKQRYDHEGYHQVTLAQGYWLADTTCTQALWQAVMGENPSDFKESPENPVENVNWLDVQRFIAKLKQQAPGLPIQLPSEAQWENACRSGTQTLFSFGENITPEQANYDGNPPYADGKKGEYREKTVPVKSLPSNPWGLYEMHGNVLEWCFDEWEENLGTDPQVDPVQAQFKSGVKPGPAGGSLASTSLFNSEMLENADDSNVPRVLRGGSWNYSGGDCRSAIRLYSDTGIRYRTFGFRLSLGLELQHSAVSRSDKAAETSEQAEPNRERRGAAGGLDQSASGSGKGVFSKVKDWFGRKDET